MNQHQPSGEELNGLIEASSNGNPVAWAKLWTHVKPVIAKAAKTAGLFNCEDVEDLTHDAFIKIPKKLSEYKPAMPFFGWVFTIAFYMAHDLHRANKRHSHSNNLEDGSAKDCPPHETIGEVEKNEAVRKMLSQMKYGIPLILHFLEEMRYKEIAIQLDTKIGTVSTWISHGKAELRDLLEKQYPQLYQDLKGFAPRKKKTLETEHKS
jgi:RNA polymerase sigma-70 factor, ECF subfamily